MTIHQYDLRYIKAEHFNGYDRPAGLLFDMAVFVTEERLEPTDITFHFDIETATYSGTVYYEVV